MLRERIFHYWDCVLFVPLTTLSLAAISPLSIWLNGGTSFIPVRSLSGL